MTQVFKIGGNVIDNIEELRKFLKDFASVPGKKILVHGGGKEASELSRKMGVEPMMTNGRRITDEKTLEIVTMVYAGMINKRIVSILQEYECNAVGLSGADGNVIPAKKRDVFPVDFGFVGDIEPSDINTDFISLLCENNYTPVFCAICRDKKGGLLNCNADSIASALAIAISKSNTAELIYCFEKQGVLDAEGNVINKITPETFDNMVKEGEIYGGMIPKVDNALKALAQGVDSVRICSSQNFLNSKGTLIS